jgi:ribonuclease G
MPGMQAAFVEVGLDRAAGFLHASDIVRSIPALLSETAENGPSPPPPISELVHEGRKSSCRSSRIRSARRGRV